jgi:hypothetical protein
VGKLSTRQYWKNKHWNIETRLTCLPEFLSQRQQLPVSGYKQQALYITLLGKSEVINFGLMG